MKRALAIVVGSGALALTAPAAADGPRGLRLIARGDSSSGQHWELRARADRGEIVTEISLPSARGGDGGGFFEGPLVRQRPLNFTTGSGFGAAQECEVDGHVYKTVATIRIDTPAGALTFRPRRAPRAAVRRWPELRRARFFVRFFPNDACPTGVTALDAAGGVLQHEDIAG